MRAQDCTHTMTRGPATGPVGAARAQSVPYTLRDIFLALVLQILLWRERSRQRRHLAQLSDHMLHDIGLSRADVWSECEKPFWRP
jgi:uncharacterized protein YjiS (DUF1127 family)